MVCAWLHARAEPCFSNNCEVSGHWKSQIFECLGILAYGHFGTGTRMLKYLCWNVYCIASFQNVYVPKRPCAKISLCQNVPVPLLKHPWWQNIPMLKCTCAKISSCGKVFLPKCLLQKCHGWNKPKPPKLHNQFYHKAQCCLKRESFQAWTPLA